MTPNEQKFFDDLKNKSHAKGVNKLCRIVSYEYLEQNDLLENETVINELKGIISSNMHYKVRKNAYETCKKLGIDCGELKIFDVDEDECIRMVNIFEFMKSKKWLKPYNAPKFRVAYNSVYPHEYHRKVYRMGKKKKKSQMFLLYRKYYQYFIEDNQYEYWLHKRDEYLKGEI